MNSKQSQQPKDGGQGLSQTSRGLYVKGFIEQESVDWLVDTGAVRTILSRKVYEKLPDHQRFHLRDENTDIYLADGHKTQKCGTGETAVRSSQELTFSVVVANIDDDAILGMDFLSQTNATLDPARHNHC